MQFGISFLPDASPRTKSPTDYFSDALDLAVMADMGGLQTIKMTQHFLDPYGGYCPSPLSFFSAVAARTSQIRMITGGILPIFSHPIQIASETAMVDAISKGRLEVGFARAYMPYEFDSFEISLNESRERYVATIEAVIKLWTGSNVTIKSPYFTFHNVTILPPPTQRPHPPVWCTAVRSRQSFAWIGQKQFKLMATSLITHKEMLAEFIEIYRSEFRSSSSPGSANAEVAVSLPLYVSETDAKAINEADLYLKRYFDVWAAAAASWDNRTSDDYPGYQGMSNAIRGVSAESMRKNLSAIVGCPDRVIDSVRSLREYLNPDHIMWQVDFGAMPREHAVPSLGLFIEKVLPNLRSG